MHRYLPTQPLILVTISSWPQLHSFSIGLPHAPDLLAARKVAAFLGTVHHEYVFTVQEGIDAIPDVIYHLETYDITTVRASTPMYLLSRKIKAMGVKMVLSGEGSDEIFGGKSKSFGNSRSIFISMLSRLSLLPCRPRFPIISSGVRETCEKPSYGRLLACQQVSAFTCLDGCASLPPRSTMAWGLEARVPFLDKAFLDVAMAIDPKEKMFSKGDVQEFDQDGCPKMEKVRPRIKIHFLSLSSLYEIAVYFAESI